ncbi:MAG: serine/threonine protein phosphatase, partial [Firmicutes bacterium]|nr:serine/threonine protein phosphatase [Bacillota bacterium]
MAGRILVMADIHGYHEALVRLLRQADYRPGVDLLVLLGDYIDRGPQGVEVVATVRELVAAGAVALKGNHEQMLLDYLTGDLEESVYLWNGGAPTLAGYRLAGREVLLSDLSWMEGLPLYYEYGPYVFVHAGLRPGRALAEQSPYDLLWIREEFYTFPTGLADRTVVFGHTPTVFF